MDSPASECKRFEIKTAISICPKKCSNAGERGLSETTQRMKRNESNESAQDLIKGDAFLTALSILLWALRMLAATTRSARPLRRSSLIRAALRAKSTQVEGTGPAGQGAIGEDGRHELWREGIYDHDNEPK
jgi:hypothetical protein